ncbi:unnamed protein product [Pieris macdunnoughi]|uniref:Uncharacterized protein n=1 Tax=Pieris macdunnoughi TaxID=345717 RepID=A0A821V5C9_9NEOP|nr:unnamed protein product [Pieris macdunnoughi]
MTRKRQYDFYCYRTTVRNQRDLKRKGTQISPIFQDISFSPPPYDISTTGTTVDKSPPSRKNKQNICKCRPKTWKSIVDLYDNQDTTVVWDNEGPITNNLEDQYRIHDTAKKSNTKKDKKVRSRLFKNKGSYKISRKKKKHKNKDNKKHNNEDELFVKPKLYAENKKICHKGPCKANIEAGKKHNCKCKRVKEHNRKTTTCTDKSCNIYRICNLPRTCLEAISSIFHKGQNISQQSIVVNKKPMFAIRVDSSSLQVLNPNEIKTKVKTFGTVGKNDKCVCPSRLEKAKRYGIGETCEGGVCEAARHGKYDKFNCHCAKTALIECCDTTCDVKTSEGKLKKTTNIARKIVPKVLDKPVFEMVLDNNHMNVLNTGEIHDVLRKASYSDMCPTGICKATANKDRILNCKCLSKKISPVLHECNKKTCQPKDESKKKSKFYICTKICRSLENWCKNNQGDINNEEIADKRIYKYSLKKNKPAAKAQLATKVKPAVTKLKTAEVNQTAMTKPKRSRLCFICSRIYSSLGNWIYVSDDNKGQERTEPQSKRWLGAPRRNVRNEPPSKHIKSPKVSEPKRKPKNTEKVIKNRNLQIRRKGIQLIKSVRKLKLGKGNRSFAEETNKAMSKKMKQKEQHISKDSRKREKMLLKQEKQKKKEIMKRKQEINRLHNKEEHHLNCLAAFVIGVVNLNLQTLRGLITAVLTIITDPIHCYIYTKHRLKDPVGSCKMFNHWLINTWRARDTKISSMVQDSHLIDVLSDHIEDSAMFQMFTSKGQTPEERQMYERKKRRRQKRIRKRHQQAVYSCRHTLLMTLRKHPCLWIYHICPFFYPQCLGLLSFVKNFFHLLLYLAALLCWTPCIMCMEVVPKVTTAKSKQFHKNNTWTPQNPSNNDEDNLNILFPNI